MLLEAVTLILGYYLFCVVGIYLHAVVKSRQYLGFWTWKLKDGHIGVCKYPRWCSFWIEPIIKKVRGRNAD